RSRVGIFGNLCQPGQEASLFYADMVRRKMIVKRLPVSDRKVGGRLAGYILDQAAAQAYVDDLTAAADPKDRLFCLYGGPEEGQFHPVPGRGHVSAHAVGFLSPQKGMEIRAAGKEDPAAQRKNLLDIFSVYFKREKKR